MEKAIFVLLFASVDGMIMPVFDPCYFLPGSVYAGGGMCFSAPYNTTQAFHRAQSICKNEGGTLAEVTTAQQRDAAKNFIYLGSLVYLGASRTTQESKMTWLSDQDEVSVPTHWWSGSTFPQISGIDICMAIDGDSLLQGVACGIKRGYICQIYAGNPCDAFLPGAEYYDRKCFLPVREEMTFEDAAAHCESLGSTLVVPKTTHLNNYLMDLVRWSFGTAEVALWLGLTRYSADYFQWQSTGELVSPYDLGLNFEYPLTVDDAVVMNRAWSWAWQIVSKSSLAQAVCQRDIIGECSGLFAQRRCYTLLQSVRTWSEARDSCRDKGGYLGEPKTMVTALATARLIRRKLSTKGVIYGNETSVFLGGSREVGESELVWQHSRQPVDEAFTYWNVGEPNFLDGIERYMEYRTVDGGWNDVRHGGDSPGDQLYYYLCETIVYSHTYLVALPKDGWAGRTGNTNGLLSMVAQPGRVDHNTVEITTFPGGDLIGRTDSVLKPFILVLDIAGLATGDASDEKRYIQVRSIDSLDVHLFLWDQDNMSLCGALVFEVLASGGPSAFFVNSGLNENSVAVLSTSDFDLENMTLVFPQNTGTFSLQGLDIQSRTVEMSTSLTAQSPVLHLDSVSGSVTSTLVYSTGPMSVFSYGRETASVDKTCDQAVPTSLVAADYVTFPSLPLNVAVTDHFTLVAVYANTTITVYDLDPAVEPMVVTLQLPGDSYDLGLPASGFHYVNGTDPFYLYARLTGEDPTKSLCSLTLVGKLMYRDSYHVAIVGPLTETASMTYYVVVIVRTVQRGNVVVVAPNGYTQLPAKCMNVPGTVWSGCFFELTNPVSGSVYKIKMDSLTTSRFGAYLLTRHVHSASLLCMALGVAENTAESSLPEFSYSDYLERLDTILTCNDDTAVPETLTTPATAAETVPATETETVAVTTAASPPVTTVPSVDTTAAETTMEAHVSTAASAPDSTTTTVEMTASTGTNPANCLSVLIPDTNVTLTPEEVQQTLHEIKNYLTVTKYNLSAVRRRKISAPDNRTSSTGLGLFSISMIFTFLALILISDLGKIYSDVRSIYWT